MARGSQPSRRAATKAAVSRAPAKKVGAKKVAAKKVAAKKVPARRAAGRAAGSGVAIGDVHVRMYNVGFGDSFLLTLPTDSGPRTVLIDCGQHIGGKANRMNDILDDLIAAVTVGGKARIDVVVATHRHFDHISGFDSARWDAVEVGEVWMPWTEERGDPEADKIRTAQQRVAAALRARFGAADTEIGFFALNSFSNAGAEDTLLHGFTGVQARRYLPVPERGDRTFSTQLLPGLTIHALGPSFDKAVIATLIPPEDQVFRAMDVLAASERWTPAANGSPLFADHHVVDDVTLQRENPAFVERADTAALVQAANQDLLVAAAGLEDAINGTSLMLVFEIGDQVLLFAGDAEWGTWKEVLADPGWRELLSRTTVYKVSHHGSFNGTPTGFAADLLSDRAISLMSYADVEKFPSIPLPELVTALEAPGRTLIRSDDMPAAGGRITRNGQLWVQLDVPVRAGAAVRASADLAALRARSNRLFTELLSEEVTPPNAFLPARRGVAAGPSDAPPSAPAFNWFDPTNAVAASMLAFQLGAAASKADNTDPDRAADLGLAAALDLAEGARARAAPEQVRQGLALFVTHDRRGRRLLKPRAVAAAPALFPRSRGRARSTGRRRAISIGGASPELDYWREDALANEHHQHWHEVYPYSGLPPADFAEWTQGTPKATLITILSTLAPGQDWQSQLSGATTTQIATFFAEQVFPSDAVLALPPDLYRAMFRLNDRQGELFFYMHAQMLARYDAELLSHGLERVEPFVPAAWDDPIPEGQDPEALSPPFFIRPPNQTLAAAEVATLIMLEAEIDQAVTTGKLVDASGNSVTINRTTLGEAVEATIPQLRTLDPNRYGGLHNQGHGAFAQLSSGGPGVMTSTVTAIRDQIFWRWHKYIDDINASWQSTQPAYPFDDEPPVTIRGGLVASPPPWSSPDLILCRTADLPAGVEPAIVGEQLFGGANWDVDFRAATATRGGQSITTVSELTTAMASRSVGGVAVTYLTHEPFTYFLRIENPTSTAVRVTVRIFLAPAELVGDRRSWIEMDKFLADLPAKTRAVVHRPDFEASVIKRPAETDPGSVTPGGGDPGENAYCDCGWPYTLLLPRGTPHGMEFRLMAICTDANIDQVAAPAHCGSMSYCGAVDGYPDTRDMGYPFARPLGTGPNAVRDRIAGIGSAAARTITIRHT